MGQKNSRSLQHRITRGAIDELIMDIEQLHLQIVSRFTHGNGDICTDELNGYITQFTTSKLHELLYRLEKQAKSYAEEYGTLQSRKTQVEAIPISAIKQLREELK